MHRRPLGQGRTLAVLAGVAILVGCFLPWWRVGGADGITPLEGNGLDGPGIIVFLIGVATLLLVALPYAIGDRPTAIDRPLSFGILAVVGWLGLGWSVVSLILREAFRFVEPAQIFTNGPGLWLAWVGLAILSRAVYQMAREPIYR